MPRKSSFYGSYNQRTQELSHLGAFGKRQFEMKRNSVDSNSVLADPDWRRSESLKNEDVIEHGE